MPANRSKPTPQISKSTEPENRAGDNPSESSRAPEDSSAPTVEVVSDKPKRKHNYPKDRASPALLKRRVANKATSLSPAQQMHAEDMQKVLVIGTGALIGLRQDKIAEEAGVSRRVIPEYLSKLAPIFPKITELAEYKEFREKVIASVEQSALESVSLQLQSCSPDDKLRDKAYAFDVLHRAGRLERGASTTNVSVKAQYTEVPLDNYGDTPSSD